MNVTMIQTVALLREKARQGASLLELVEAVHMALGLDFTVSYNRGVVMVPFQQAFGLSTPQIQVLLSWEGFGGGATQTYEAIAAQLEPLIAAAVRKPG